MFQGWMLTFSELATLSDPSHKHYSYHNMSTPESFIAALDNLENYIEAEGPFDGVIGYSRGAGLAARLLVRQQHLRPNDKRLFQCAILFSPTQAYDPVAYLEKREAKVLDKMHPGIAAIPIPVAIIYGEADETKDQCQQVKGIFEPRLLSVFVHNGGQEVPGLGVKDGLLGAIRSARRAITYAELLLRA